MAGEQPFTPDYVYQLIRSSPQGQALVENLARMNQLQQAAQQFAPQIQQFAQNPMQAMGQVGDWAQNYNQMQQQQIDPNQQAAAQPQQGGPPMQGGMIGMAMEIVNEFKGSFKDIGEKLEVINEANVSLKEELSSLHDLVTTLVNDNKTLTTDLAVAKSNLDAMRKDLGKLTSAKG